mmetsp:Transcript_11275/g.30337  ORF Transcript_11275/g.30337 Transcript_11275/m.30337 type:complete len:245 (+) Transcript_11275:470-1204(+)
MVYFVKPSEMILKLTSAWSPALISLSASFRYSILCTQQPGVSTLIFFNFLSSSPHSLVAVNLTSNLPTALYLCRSALVKVDPETGLEPSPKSTVHVLKRSESILNESSTSSPTATTRSLILNCLSLCLSQPVGQSPITRTVRATDFLLPRESYAVSLTSYFPVFANACLVAPILFVPESKSEPSPKLIVQCLKHGDDTRYSKRASSPTSTVFLTTENSKISSLSQSEAHRTALVCSNSSVADRD